MPFKMHKIIFFQKKKIIKKNVLNFLEPLPEAHIFFYLALAYIQMSLPPGAISSLLKVGL